MTSIEGGTRLHDASADLQTRVAMLGKVGWCGSPSFSPDGSRVAFVSDLNGVPQVWTVAAEGGWPELVTALDDQVEDVSWSPTGEWLAFAVAPGGGLNTQVYLVRPDGTKLLRLTEGGAENNWLGGWTRDGSALLLASNRGGGKGMDAYLAPVLEGGFRPVATNDGIGYLTDVSRGGERAVLWRMRNRGDEDLYLVDLPGGGEVLLTAHEGPCSFGGGIFSPDGRTVYLSSNKDRDLSALARVEVGEDGAVGAIEVLTERPDGELQDFALSDDGAVAALVWNVAGRSELAFFDLAAGEHRPMGELPAEVVSELTFSKDGRTVALTLSGAASPMDVWLLEAASGAFRQLTHSPHAGVDLDSLVRPELVEFEAHDGLGLSGWLYLPRGAEGPAPVVLSFHGGPEGQERPQFKTTAQALVAAGIGVFAPNVRGSSGFGKEFVNLDNGALRVNAVRDIESCVRYLVDTGAADPARIGIMGGSYGGYMTMAGLAEYPDLFAAGANLYGVVNFETFFAHTEPWMAAISKVEYGDPVTQVELLRDLSPIYKVDRVRAPTIVLHGANDTNVPVVEAEQVVASLSERGIPVEYVLFPDEGHGFEKSVNRVRATVAIVEWFRRYL